MTDIHFLFLHLLAAYPVTLYAVLLVGMMIEGEAVFFVAAYLAHAGLVNLPLILGLGYLAVIMGDLLWYQLGVWALRLPPSFHRWVDRLASPFDARLRRNPLRLIFVTKFTYGIHHALLVRAGMFRVDRWQYLRVIVIANLAWVVLIGSLGYVFGASLALVRHYLRYTEIGLLLALVIFIVFERFLGRLITSRR